MPSLEIITLEPLAESTGLNEASAINYFKANFTSLPLLENRIINPFEKLLKQKTGLHNEDVDFTENNWPTSPHTDYYKFGEITFTVNSSVERKRPALKTVVEQLEYYLSSVKDGQSGIKRRGVRTFESQPYIKLAEIIGLLADLQEAIENERLSQDVDHDTGVQSVIPVAVPLSQEITLSEGNAQLYVAAVNLQKYLKTTVVSPFKALLKSETGYDKENVPVKTVSKPVQVGLYLFQVTTIPENTISYKSILEDLTKPAPQRITNRSKIGELERIKLRLPVETKLYDPRNESGAAGNQYISVEGTLTRLFQLKLNNTKTSINQKIEGPYWLV